MPPAPAPAPAMLMECTRDYGEHCLGWYEDFMSAYRAALRRHAREVWHECLYHERDPHSWMTKEQIDERRATFEKWKPTLEAALQKTVASVAEANDFLCGRWECPGHRVYDSRWYRILCPDAHEVRRVTATDVLAGLWSDSEYGKKEKRCWCLQGSEYAKMKAQEERIEASIKEDEEDDEERERDEREEAAAMKKLRDDLGWEEDDGEKRTTELGIKLREEIRFRAIGVVWDKRRREKRAEEAAKLENQLRDEIVRRSERRRWEGWERDYFAAMHE